MAKLVAIIAAVVIAASGRAYAEDAWSVGVTEPQKASAQALLEKGNQLFLARDYTAALGVYRDALKEWDHPAIRFNIVRCLIQLENPVEASDNLAIAMKYGPAPHDPSLWQEALGYAKLLQGQIAEVAVSCEQPEVEVTIDGQRMLACPGRENRRLAPGKHQLVARRQGYLTLIRDVVVLPAKQEVVTLTLTPLSAAGVMARRWASWKPWAVVGGGAGVAAISGLLLWRSSANYDAYDRSVATLCGDPGCAPGTVPQAIDDLRGTARLQNQLGVGVLIAGGAAIVTGAVLLGFNRARIEYPSETFVAMPTRDGLTVGWGGLF